MVQSETSALVTMRSLFLTKLKLGMKIHAIYNENTV